MSNMPDKETMVQMYETISRIKQNDERIQAQIFAGKLVTPYYSARGQECIPAGVSANLTKDDYIVTIYRGIHDSIAKGLPLKLLWAELAGRVTGTCKGKGGTMHITYPETGIMVTTGIVGSGIPIGCGLALSSYFKKDGKVTVSNFGDGASNIGAFHEGLNLASIWKLPVIFMCQNNLYAEHTKYEKCTAVENVADRAAAYSMPGVIVDGNDPVAVYQASKEAIERARNGGGPTLIEAKTFRFNGHIIGDQSDYIPAEEMEAAKAADPYPIYRTRLIKAGLATEDQLDKIDANISKEIDEAIEFALSSEYPELDELKRDVFAYELA